MHMLTNPVMAIKDDDTAVQTEKIRAAIEESNGSVAAAARALDVEAHWLRRRVSVLGLTAEAEAKRAAANVRGPRTQPVDEEAIRIRIFEALEAEGWLIKPAAERAGMSLRTFIRWKSRLKIERDLDKLKREIITALATGDPPFTREGAAKLLGRSREFVAKWMEELGIPRDILRRGPNKREYELDPDLAAEKAALAKTIAGNLLALRHQVGKDVTVYEVAFALRLEPRMYEQYEAGTVLPRDVRLQRIATAYGIQADRLKWQEPPQAAEKALHRLRARVAADRGMQPPSGKE